MTTLEFNTNNEWLVAFSSVDFSEIPERDREKAADQFTFDLSRNLADKGFNVERARGQRSTCYGWNGFRTFKHKLGPVGTFDDLTEEQINQIWEAIYEAQSTMIADWKSEFFRVVDLNSGEVLAECYSHEEATEAADESEEHESQPQVAIQKRVGDEWVKVPG